MSTWDFLGHFDFANQCVRLDFCACGSFIIDIGTFCIVAWHFFLFSRALLLCLGHYYSQRTDVIAKGINKGKVHLVVLSKWYVCLLVRLSRGGYVEQSILGRLFFREGTIGDISCAFRASFWGSGGTIGLLKVILRHSGAWVDPQALFRCQGAPDALFGIYLGAMGHCLGFFKFYVWTRIDRWGFCLSIYDSGAIIFDLGAWFNNQPSRWCYWWCE